MENDLNFCRRRAVDFARRAVYSRDQKTRRALATMAQGWAELAHAVRNIEPISAEFRLAAEIREKSGLRKAYEERAPTEADARWGKEPTR